MSDKSWVIIYKMLMFVPDTMAGSSSRVRAGG